MPVVGAPLDFGDGLVVAGEGVDALADVAEVP